MIDPREGIPLIEEAYSLAASGSVVTTADDLIFGRHIDGDQHLFAVVRGRAIGVRGTMVFGYDPVEWIEDAAVLPVATPFGEIASGVWSIYRTFRTQSGRPLSAFAGYDVHGHSLGAGLAAILSVALHGEHVLWACPNWFGPKFGGEFAKLGGYVFANAGDVVPWLPLPTPANPRLGPVTHLMPPAGTDGLAAHHAMATYVTAYNAQFPEKEAA